MGLMEQSGNTSPECRFIPPEGVGPALARVICRGGYDGRAFAAAILSLVAQGYIKLEEDAGDYILKRGTSTVWQPKKSEAALLNKLFSGIDSVPVDGSSYLHLTAAMRAHYRAMKAEVRACRGKAWRLWLAGGVTAVAVTAQLIIEARRPVLGSSLDGSGFLGIAVTIALGAFVMWLFTRMRDRGVSLKAGLEDYRDYLRIAVAPRLEPSLALGTRHDEVTPEHAFLVAFGLPNSALDTFVAAVASVAGHAPEHTSLHSLYRRAPGGRKRGWQFEEPSIFWRTW